MYRCYVLAQRKDFLLRPWKQNQAHASRRCMIKKGLIVLVLSWPSVDSSDGLILLPNTQIIGLDYRVSLDQSSKVARQGIAAQIRSYA